MTSVADIFIIFLLFFKFSLCPNWAEIALGYDRNRIFRPDTGMKAKSGSGIAGNGMLFKSPVPVKPERECYFEIPVPALPEPECHLKFRFKPEFKRIFHYTHQG